MQNEELNKKLNDFLKEFEGVSCEKAPEELINRLSELFGGKMQQSAVFVTKLSFEKFFGSITLLLMFVKILNSFDTRTS